MKAELNLIKPLARKPKHLSAIKAKCAECVGCSESHLETGFRDLISTCKSEICPLHQYRPYRANSLTRTLSNGVAGSAQGVKSG